MIKAILFVSIILLQRDIYLVTLNRRIANFSTFVNCTFILPVIESTEFYFRITLYTLELRVDFSRGRKRVRVRSRIELVTRIRKENFASLKETEFIESYNRVRELAITISSVSVIHIYIHIQR